MGIPAKGDGAARCVNFTSLAEQPDPWTIAGGPGVVTVDPVEAELAGPLLRVVGGQRVDVPAPVLRGAAAGRPELHVVDGDGGDVDAGAAPRADVHLDVLLPVRPAADRQPLGGQQVPAVVPPQPGLPDALAVGMQVEPDRVAGLERV